MYQQVGVLTWTIIEYSSIFDLFTSEEQQSTNQNKKNKKKFGEKNKESSENNDPNRKNNSEAKISHAEKDMKNLPI